MKYGYDRVSTDDQKGPHATRRAEADGCEKILADDGKSGATVSRG
jgi:DNA invertase Pin-like site-specific DNA recombinase